MKIYGNPAKKTCMTDKSHTYYISRTRHKFTSRGVHVALRSDNIV